MKISGFTFVRNLKRLDYPFIESIKSILPIVDEFIVNVGPDEDGTLDAVQAIDDKKIKIIRSQWNSNFAQGGYVLTQQTNIALFNCTGDWAFCLQADEVIHEEEHEKLLRIMERYVDDDGVEGIGLKRLNFYGDYRTILDVHPWNTGIISRIVKPHLFAMSRADSNEFTVHPKYKEKGRAIRIVDSGARLFHYMDVKTAAARKVKAAAAAQIWGGLENRDGDALSDMSDEEAYYYQKYPRQFAAAFVGSHPKVMQERIGEHGVNLDHSSPRWRTDLSSSERKQLAKSKPLAQWVRRVFGKKTYRIVGGDRS